MASAIQDRPFLSEKVEQCPLCSGAITAYDPGYNRSKCRSCGYIFENPRPGFREIAEFYSRPAKYDSWLVLEGERASLWRRRLRLILQYRKHGTLLDVGTG